MASEQQSPQWSLAAGPEAAMQGLSATVANPMVPKLYLQAFGSFSSPVDITLITVNCNVATGALSLSYSVAKSLAKALSDMVVAHEVATGAKVLSAEEAQQAVQVSMVAPAATAAAAPAAASKRS